ncbi:hypothetical protein CALVIDRAFT_534822, partial [Calocera viscosa TUFC12733]
MSMLILDLNERSDPGDVVAAIERSIHLREEHLTLTRVPEIPPSEASAFEDRIRTRLEQLVNRGTGHQFSNDLELHLYIWNSVAETGAFFPPGTH